MSDEPRTEVTTRGELLQHADHLLTSGHRSLFSARRTLPVIGWSIALGVLLITQFSVDLDADDLDTASQTAFFVSLGVLWWLVARLVPGRAVVGHGVAAVLVVVVGAIALPFVEDLDADGGRAWFLGVWAVVAAGTAWATWTYGRRTEADVRQVEAAQSLPREPSGRALPDDDVPLELATMHDIRDRADFDDVAGQVVVRATAPVYSFATLKPFLALMITGLVGLVLALASLAGLGDSDWAVAAALSGLLLFAPWAWASVAGGRVLARRQDELNRVGVESRLYAVRRHHTTGAPVAAPSSASLLRSPAGALLAVVWVAVVIARLRSSSGLAITVTLAILAVATVAVALRVLLRSRQARVYPLAGDGDTVLQAPGRVVALSLTGDRLQISDPNGGTHQVDVADVVAVEPVTGLRALAGTGVAIVTTGDPVVLTGGGVERDPAIVALRERLA